MIPSPHIITTWPTRPTLALMVEAFMQPPIPFTKRESVRAVVEHHMELGNGYGQGNAAKRRARALVEAAQALSDREQNVRAIAEASQAANDEARQLERDVESEIKRVDLACLWRRQ